MLNETLSLCVAQLLGDLPPGRVAAYEAAFTHTGINYFGPFHVLTTQRIWGRGDIHVPNIACSSHRYSRQLEQGRLYQRN